MRPREKGIHRSGTARLAALVMGLFCASVSPARADEIALPRFQPSAPGDRFLGLPSPYVAGNLDLHTSVLAEYAHRPLILRRIPDGVETGALVAGQALFHASAALALRRRLLLHVDVPFLALQTTELEEGPGLADFGDLRFGARVRLFGADASPLQIALGVDVWAPTGTGEFVTDGAVRGRPYVAGGGIVGPLLWSAMLGAEIRPSQLYRDSVPQGASLQGALGAGYFLDDLRSVQLGAELTAALSLERPEARNAHAELLFEGRYRFLQNVEIAAGIGPGLTEGIGTPQFRAVLSLAYVPVADLTPPRRPRAAGDWPTTTHSTTVGAEPAPAPLPLPITPEEAPSQLGSNVRIGVIGDEVVPEESLQFAFGSADLHPEAERVLHALADFLIAHPELRKVEVRGYADIDGTLSANERLAQRRADAVRQALIHHSIEPARLSARGLGPRDPTASSTSTEGRQMNRRVELWVVERTAP